jgi:hypothetical protein
LKLLIQAHTAHLARALSERLNAAAMPALAEYVEGEKRRAEGEWYTLVTRQTGDSGKLRTRTYRTKGGTLRAKVGSDAKYARTLFASNGKRVLDETLTRPMRGNVAAGFGSALAKALK